MSDEVIEIKATVGPKALANVDRYFTNDIRTIATELLGNARRAGAANVRVSVDHRASTVTVADDGRGIDKADAGLLVTFGGSGNDDVTEGDEAPAGMGFFSLARRGARVRTRDWAMEVPPGAFTGAEPARLVDGYDPVVGTTMTFHDPMARLANTAQQIYGAFARVAQAMPYRTVVNGDEVERFSPIDRLRGADGRPLFSDMVEERVGDCIVVVARFEDGRRRFARQAPSDESGWDRMDWLPSVFVSAEIFGQVMDLGRHRTDEFAEGFDVCVEGELMVTKPDGGGWRQVTPAYLVVLQAIGSETLVPRLPDRHELVETPGLAAIAGASRTMVARLAARAPRHGVDPGHWVARVCRREGIPLGPRQTVLYRPSCVGEGESRGRDVRAVHDAGVPPSGDGARTIILANAGVNASLLLETACAKRGRKGAITSRAVQGEVDDLAGFDPITTMGLAVDGVSYALFDADLEGESEDVPNLSDEDCLIPYELFDEEVKRVDRITVTLRTRSGVQEKATLAHLVWRDEEGLPSAIVTASATPRTVARAMLKATVFENDDPDLLEDEMEETYDRQLRLVTGAVLGPARAAAGAVAEMARRVVEGSVRSVTMVLDDRARKDRGGTITVVMVDGTTTTTTVEDAIRDFAPSRPDFDED